MNTYIEIHYISNNTKVRQGGTFQLRGRKPDQVALEFWKHIKKDMSYRVQLEKILANGNDITQLVMDRQGNTMDNLPF